MKKVYSDSYRGRRSEPAGLHRRRTQVTKAEEGLLELRREKGKGKGEKGKCWGKKMGEGKARARACSER